MFNWFYNLPNIGIALLFGAVGATLFSCVPFFREKWLRIPLLNDQSKGARNAFGVVIGFTGVVLAFSLVEAQSNLRNLENGVGIEAHDLAQLDRLLLQYDDSGVDPIR